jgi:MFS family permease
MVSEGASDPVIAGIVANDKTPWYKKPNLRMLYLFLVPCTLAIEATGGFDASMMNGLQSLKYWQAAFDYPQGSILGILTASYNLGAITALPFVSILSDHVGRRWAIMFGSLVMVVGAILQCFSVNSTLHSRKMKCLCNSDNTHHSHYVGLCPYLPWPRLSLLRRRWFVFDW